MTRATALAPTDRWLHASLVAVWLGTAAVSAIEARGQSLRLLADAGLHDPHWQAALIWSGIAADAAIGLWLAWRPGRASFAAALGLMGLMTVAATALQPALWLHPLGPLLKNLPIAALLLHFLRRNDGPLGKERLMNTYLLLKTVHILSSVLLVGTGFGSAFYLFFVNRSSDVHAQAVVSRLVVRADLWFTTPAALVQPLSGIALAHMAGWPLATPWLALSLGLYALAGACWLPVLWLQVRMARLAQEAATHDHALPADYRRLARVWEALGYPAFIAMLAVYWLMVNKPALWAS